jgi:subfamily B ATP-binding cassette protein MsbA
MIVRGSILGIYAISMLWISWQLTIVVVILFTLTALLISKLFTIIREVSFKTTKARSEYTSRAIEFINGIRTIKVSVAEDFERRKIDQSAFDVFTTEKQSWFTKAIVEPIPEALSVILVLGILIFCFEFLIPAGKLQIASLLTLLFIIVRTLPIVRQLNSARGSVNQHQGAVRATKKLLEPQGKPFFENGYRKFRGLEREIVFDGVDFAYNPDSLVLKNINLSIKCGEMVALVGASGAGKTTLADLLPRFYDPTGGKILVDGVDLRSLEIDSWRSKMSVVSQDTFIFNTSVRENIAYGLDDVPEDMVIEAAKQANALEFIQGLSDGFDSVLGDRGLLLSGGQRQRIAIARALLRNPQILILDEATSALDSITERLIQESIEQLAVGRTVIAIAHRLSTIARADKIVVLEKGQIVEEGTYQELLDKKEQFWQYHQMQK